MVEGFKPGMLRKLLRGNYQSDKVIIPNKNPEIQPDGITKTYFVFEASVDVRAKYGRASPSRMVPHLMGRSADDILEGIGDKELSKILWSDAKRMVDSRIKGASAEYQYELLTQEMTNRVTRMEHACLLLYSSVLVQEFVKNPDNIKDASQKMAEWFEEMVRHSLSSIGYSDSRLLGSIRAEPYEVKQVKGGKYKFRIRLGVMLEMMAYGFILDIGRGPTTGGKHIPYQAIYDWCKRKGINPSGINRSTGKVSTFSEMVSSIRWKIDKFGYEQRPFISPVLNEAVANGLPEYFVWQRLNSKIESLLQDGARRSKEKYRGFRKRIDEYTITIK